MAKFVSLDVVNVGSNGARPARINADAIAYVTTAGEQHDPDGHALVVFVGGSGVGSPGASIVVTQTVAQVAALLA